jgi:hypothetical protein
MAAVGYAAPGDPAKMAKAIVDTLDAENAPPRLALGPDVYGYIKTALQTGWNRSRLTRVSRCRPTATMW